MDFRTTFLLGKNRLRRTLTHATRRALGKQRIIASLTSYPARIGTVHIAIQSLLAQRTLPDLIVCWLCTNDFPNREHDLPRELRALLAPDVQIRWVEHDLKPHKKYFWAFREFKDDLVITFDDDLTYRNTLISELISAHAEHPRCVCAARTHLMAFDESTGKPKPYADWTLEAPVAQPDLVGNPRMDLFATTGAGTLFCPPLLPDETFDMDAICDLCMNADDVWLKVMQVLAGIPVVAATADQALTYIPETQDTALWRGNIDGGGNDAYLGCLLKRYDIPVEALRTR